MAITKQQEDALIMNQQEDSKLGVIPTATYTAPTTTLNSYIPPVSTTISTDNLKTTETPLVTTTPKPSTEMAGLQGTIEAGANDFAKKIVDEQKLADEKKASEDAYKTFSDKILGQKTPSDLTSSAYNEAGVDTAKTELNDINSQILSEQLANRRRIEAIQGNSSLTKEQAQQQASEINRQSVSKQADLAVIQYAKQNNFAQAKEIADRKISAELEAQKNDLEAYKFMYQENKDKFTKDEDRKISAYVTERERLLKQEEVKKKTISDLSLEALKGGAPASVASQMQKATTPEEAISLGGQYIGSLDRQKLKLETTKLQNEINANAPVTGEWAGVINGASGLVANTKKQQVKTNIGNAIANNDWNTAYAEIGNSVSDGLTGTPKTKFDDARTDIGIMTGMRTAIKNYADAGGDMGLLSGTEEEIKRKLGIDSGKASTLAVQLWREFQTYRSNMTGAAFTPTESRDYAAVNPTLGKSLNLNLSVIDGAINQLGNRVNSTIDARLPDAKKIRTKMETTLPAKDRVKTFYDTADTTTKTGIDKMIQDGLDWETIIKVLNQ